MPLTKALILNLDDGVSIPVMFNPSEYQLQRTNNYAEIKVPGCDTTQIQFVQGDAQTLSVELFFDTSSQGFDVRSYTDQIVKLTKINPDTGEPPTLLFWWGTLVFSCIMTSVSHKYEYFDALGQALRARLSVTLKGYDYLEQFGDQMKVSPLSNLKGLVFKSGDTLQSLAGKEYKDTGKWRKIAEANKINNPLTIRPGTRLNIPKL
ncbi:MAG: LysM peptidoglycan-binding domain-containing protein [Clostridia bacterium]|nr:LysM peptidoglycan-binding domain-containing protein [Clostridia bacterium]